MRSRLGAIGKDKKKQPSTPQHLQIVCEVLLVNVRHKSVIPPYDLGKVNVLIVVCTAAHCRLRRSCGIGSSLPKVHVTVDIEASALLFHTVVEMEVQLQVHIKPLRDAGNRNSSLKLTYTPQHQIRK